MRSIRKVIHRNVRGAPAWIILDYMKEYGIRKITKMTALLMIAVAIGTLSPEGRAHAGINEDIRTTGREIKEAREWVTFWQKKMMELTAKIGELRTVARPTAAEVAQIQNLEAQLASYRGQVTQAGEALSLLEQGKEALGQARGKLDQASMIQRQLNSTTQTFTAQVRTQMSQQMAQLLRQAHQFKDNAREFLRQAVNIKNSLAASVTALAALATAATDLLAAMLARLAAVTTSIAARVIPPVAAVATGMSIGTFNLWGRYMGKIQAINMACVQLQNCRNMVRVAVQMGMPAPVCNPTDLEIQNNITALSRDAAAIAAVYNAIPLLDDIAPPIPRCAA